MKTKVKKNHKRAYELLAEAAYSDPFATLGPFANDEEGSLRVWMPGADKVELVVEGEPRVELKRDGDSIFVLEEVRDLHLTHYQLAVNWDGVEQLVDDPYQYHNIYQEYEHLHTPKDMYHYMGSHFVTMERDGKNISGVRFLVYAPHASAISLVGSFNQWDGRRHPMQRLDYGIWGLFIPDLEEGVQYKLSSKDQMGKGFLTNKTLGVSSQSNTRLSHRLRTIIIVTNGKTPNGKTERSRKNVMRLYPSTNSMLVLGSAMRTVIS